MSKKQFKVGDRVKITVGRGGASSACALKTGIISSAVAGSPAGVNKQWYINDSNTTANITYTWAYERELDLAIQTKEEIDNELGELQGQIKSLESKKRWMDETGSKVFDDTEFKAWEVIETLEDPNLSKIQRARLIAKIINGS